MFAGVAEFLEVARQGSFTRAAKALGVSKSHVSKQVRLAEDRLAVQLFHRTTRSVQLTEEGRKYRDMAARLVDELRDVEEGLRGEQTPRGVLKISIPPALTPLHEMLADFIATYPDVRLIVHSTYQQVDVIGGGYDLVVRGGELTDSSLMARRLATLRFGVFASPCYLQRAGTPASVAETARHRWLVFSLHGTALTQQVEQDPGLRALREAILREGVIAMDSNSMDTLMRSCERGLGLCMLPEHLAADSVERGGLVRVLPGQLGVAVPLWGVAPPNRFASAKVDALMATLLRSSLGR